MKYTGITRPIDELGRVVIPKEIRKTLDIKAKDLLEIYTEGDMMILKKSGEECVLCGAKDELLPYNGKLVCRDCAKALNNMLL